MTIGLKVDVDTLRGTRHGVPELRRLLERHGIRATFFFSVGPDNMGRHLWRLLRPAFLVKMLRTRAASLYGWDILLRGTFAPGPLIARRAGTAIAEVASAGHEVGLHAWDHHAWQTRIGEMTGPEVGEHLDRAFQALSQVAGRPPSCSAAPAWRVTEAALAEKRRLPFAFNSDCRGSAPFLPLLADGSVGQLQIPTTLPTYDERVGQGGRTARDYYTELLEAIGVGGFQVLTIHAEVEGLVARELFAGFLEQSLERGHSWAPLGDLAAAHVDPPVAELRRAEIEGREGWASWQGPPTVRSERSATGGVS